MTASDIRNVQADGAESVGDEAATTDARPRLPHLNRTDPPAYLQNYLNREAQGSGARARRGQCRPSRADDTPCIAALSHRKSGAHPLESPLPEWEDKNSVTPPAPRLRTKEIVLKMRSRQELCSRRSTSFGTEITGLLDGERPYLGQLASASARIRHLKRFKRGARRIGADTNVPARHRRAYAKAFSTA